MPLLEGLISAPYTPMDGQGELSLHALPEYVDRIIQSGCRGMYVCGSTGEGISLTTQERKAVTEAFVDAVDGRVPVVVQVGANSLPTSCELAAHAQAVGADAVSCNAPCYYKIDTPELLTNLTSRIAAAAPDLPFYYYHIPALTGAAIDLIQYLDLASDRIPNLQGIKYTETSAFVFQECMNYQEGRYEVLWGCDEMLLSALAIGAKGAIGSTYATAMPCYRRIVEAWDAGNLETARSWQLKSWQMVKVFLRHGHLHASQKAVWKMMGIDLGICRLPIPELPDGAEEKIREDLESIGFFDWAE